MAIPLINKEDVIAPRSRINRVDRDSRDKTIEKENTDKTIEKDNTDKTIEKENADKTVIKKKPEKPVRILRIRYYEKISLSFMQDGKLEHRDAFAVNRGLEDLLKALGYNTKIQGTTTSHDCILVEKGSKMGVGNKFIFIDIGTNDFYTLKKQMENYTTICAFNHGEFIIVDGKRSWLSETFDIPKIWKEEQKDTVHISETNKIVMRERLRRELKDNLKQYHLYDNDQIDKMTEKELVELKRLVNRKIDIDDRNRKFYGDLLK